MPFGFVLIAPSDPALPKSYAAQSSIGTLSAWADDQSQRGEAADKKLYRLNQDKRSQSRFPGPVMSTDSPD